MLLFSLTASLFDSLSTTQQIVIFVLLLTTVKPVQNALWYLIGLSGSYFACGIAGYQTLDQLRILLGRFFPSTSSFSDPRYYQSEFFTGIIMTGLGIWYFQKKRHSRPGRRENFVITKLRHMNGAFAFGIGVFISITSFPFSIPYLVALGKYTGLHIPLTAAIGHILVYNIGYALPMIFILVFYLIYSRDKVDPANGLHEKAQKLNVQLTTWALVGLGIFSMLDAGSYFLVGHALIKGRYF
jgi:cytochrome c biogenesis protein CcdA